MFVASTVFLLGFLHGLGADHLMAIAALSVGGRAPAASRSRRAVRVAVQFACGHAMLLAGGAAAAVVVGREWPRLTEAAGELIAGLSLVTLGAAGLWALATGRVYLHSHAHGDPPHSHWHWHFGRGHRHPGSGHHSHLPALVGAVFAVSGLRGLTMLAPAGSELLTSPLYLLALILLFALGVVCSMTLFGVVLARLLTIRTVAAVGRAAAFVTATASVALGVYWILAT